MEVEIIDYSDELKDYIKILNYEWLEEHFRVEEGDRLSLSDPQTQILDKGGFIFFAKCNGEIAGTVSLIKKTEVVFELGKMAVSKNVRGCGIGNRLMEYCLDFAKRQGILELILYSNTILEPAIHLYHKFGFEKIELEPGVYERGNIKMKKKIF